MTQQRSDRESYEHKAKQGQSEPPSVDLQGATLPAASSRRALLRKSSPVLVRVASVVALLVIWQVVSVFVPPTSVPDPRSTFSELGDLAASGSLWSNFEATMERLVGSFLLALAVGVALGTLMGVSRSAERILDLWVMVALTIPGLVYIIVSFLWFGLSELGAIVAIAATTFPSITVNIWTGVKAIDQRLVDMARVFGSSGGHRTYRVVLPQVIPYVIGATRYGFGIAWKVTVFVELMGMSNGVGYQLNYAFQIFDMPGVFAWTLFFTIVMMIIEVCIFKPLERYAFRWRPPVRA